MKFKIKGKRASRNDFLSQFINENVATGSTVLDIGCGPKAYSSPLLEQQCCVLTIDAWDWVEPDIVANVETTPIAEITNERWDYILMIDFIEHLDKDAGVRLLEDCKKIVNKKIFLLTPLPEIWTDNTHNIENKRIWSHGNQFDIHKSSWTHSDFEGWTEVKLPSLEKYYVGYYEA
jgi:cyclopropane fatty-acyl-phospholipid synthase-like methyltransferase